MPFAAACIPLTKQQLASTDGRIIKQPTNQPTNQPIPCLPLWLALLTPSHPVLSPPPTQQTPVIHPPRRSQLELSEAKAQVAKLEKQRAAVQQRLSSVEHQFGGVLGTLREELQDMGARAHQLQQELQASRAEAADNAKVRARVGACV